MTLIFPLTYYRNTFLGLKLLSIQHNHWVVSATTLINLTTIFILSRFYGIGQVHLVNIMRGFKGKTFSSYSP